MRKTEMLILAIFLSLILTGSVFSFENPVNIHGFIAQGYLKTSANNIIADSEDGTFQLNEMGINFTNEPMDKLRIGMQFFARDFGNIGNDDIILDWAFADYRLHDKFGIRGGKVKSPVGLYQEVRDVDMLRTSITLSTAVYDENLRDTANSIQGVGIYGDINTDRFGSFTYQAIAGTNNVPGDGGTALFLGSDMVNISNVNMKEILNLALLWNDPTGMLRLSQTAWFSDIEAEGVLQSNSSIKVNYYLDNIEIYASSVELTWNSFVFAYECLVTNSKLTLIALGNPVPGYDGKKLYTFGYFGSVSYRINERFEVGYYYNEYYDDRNDRHGRKLTAEGDMDHKRWHKASSFLLRCDLNSNWVLKLEYQYVDGSAKLLAPLNEEYDRYWHMFISKLSFNF